MAMGMYTRERVLAKTFAWRIIATLTGAAVAGLLTGEIETAGSVSYTHLTLPTICSV